MMSIGITRSKEATCFINKMNKPTKVFAYHANEAAVRQGKIVPGKRSVASIKGKVVGACAVEWQDDVI